MGLEAELGRIFGMPVVVSAVAKPGTILVINQADLDRIQQAWRSELNRGLSPIPDAWKYRLGAFADTMRDLAPAFRGLTLAELDARDERKRFGEAMRKLQADLALELAWAADWWHYGTRRAWWD